MEIHRTNAIQYAHDQRDRFLKDLREYASIPSVSTDPNAVADIQRTAEWTAAHLKSIGMSRVEVMPTGGHPVVYAELLKAGPKAPTLLVYGHYDVQPAEPLELWESKPYEPTVRGEHIYARGIADMKGQVLAAMDAIEAVVRTSDPNNPLPVNLKVIIEGEEEIGSPNLALFLRTHKDLLASDLALNPDSGILSADQPTITHALRGLAYFELRVYGPKHDLHSGTFGGTVYNPAQALCDLIAGMHALDGKITLPGFYDSVRLLSREERAELKRLPTGEDYFLEQTGAPALWGEPDFTPGERTGARPTLEVNGLLSGYTGEGSKTVLPAWAMAKLSMRLVPDQDPSAVHQQLLRYMEAHTSPSIRWEVKSLVGNPAAISDRDSQGVKALTKAMETVWGKRPLFRREGGSVPVVTEFKEILGIESVNTGFSMPGDNAHAPNEQLHLPTWYRGIDALIHFLFNLSEG